MNINPDVTAPLDGFSIRLRRATLTEHRATERAPFVRNLLTGKLPIAGYTAMTGQWYFLYQALEDEAAAHRTHPVLGPFVAEALIRLPALADDLGSLIGPDWRRGLEPLPATDAYVDRLRRIAVDWPTGLLAHHYLRYLGDLSGGQIIARVVRRTYGDAGDRATRFYRFEQIDDLDAFKASYRERLDRLPIDDAERQRLIDEVDDGYRMTARIFDELDRSYADD